jgi:Nuclease-related domain
MRFPWIFKQTRTAILALVAIDIVLFILTAVSFQLNPYISLTLSLLMLALTINILKRLHRLGKGLDGEEKVRKILKKLPPEFTFLNEFRYNNLASADFIVIGPTGVFTIEVKNYHAKEITYHNETLMGDGKLFKENVLHQAYEEMKNLQGFLTNAEISVTVSPIVVFANHRATMHFGLNPLRGVYVVGISWLQKTILEHPHILTPEQCTAIRNEIQKYTSII